MATYNPIHITKRLLGAATRTINDDPATATALSNVISLYMRDTFGALEKQGIPPEESSALFSSAISDAVAKTAEDGKRVSITRTLSEGLGKSMSVVSQIMNDPSLPAIQEKLTGAMKPFFELSASRGLSLQTIELIALNASNQTYKEMTEGIPPMSELAAERNALSAVWHGASNQLERDDPARRLATRVARATDRAFGVVRISDNPDEEARATLSIHRERASGSKDSRGKS